MTQKFEIGDRVFKWTGDYTGPGTVRGVTIIEQGGRAPKVRYLVGHRIEGGTGEFLHIYAEGNLRGYDLPHISKADALLARTGQPMDAGITGNVGCECHGAVGVPPED